MSSGPLEVTPRRFGMVKEGMATGAFPAESGSSQIPEVIMAQSNQQLDFKDAERVAAMRAMGKANNLFRNGKVAHEREAVIDALYRMVRNEQTREGKARWRFAKTTYPCIAAVAVDELCWDACPTCSGAGQVPHDFAHSAPSGRIPMVTCPTCSGNRKRNYTTDERVTALAKAWLAVQKTDGDVTELAAEIRKDKRLHGMVEAIEWARGKLLEAERMAVEGAVQMLENY